MVRKALSHAIFVLVILLLGFFVFTPFKPLVVQAQHGGSGAHDSTRDYLKRVNTDVTPAANNTYSLGSSAKKFKTADIVTLNATTASVSAISGLTSNGVVVTSGGIGTLGVAANSSSLASSISDEVGTGNLVFANTPTLITPNLGVANATSYNKLTVTAPASDATLTIANGKTLTVNNSLTFNGTDAKVYTMPSDSATIPADSVAINTANSLTGGGDLSSSRTLNLVNDSTAPGNTYYYGTNATGVKGFYAVPETSPGGSSSHVQYNNGTGFAGSANFTFVDGASPTLNLNASSGSDAIFKLTTGLNRYAQITCYNNSGDAKGLLNLAYDGGLGLYGGGTAKGYFLNISGSLDSMDLGRANTTAINFGGSSYPYAVMNATGLGVGTATPGYRLDVNGNSNFNGTIHVAGNAGMTNSTGFWMCNAADCATKCQANVVSGLIVSCN